MDPSGSKRASAPAAAADLTDELIVEILSRLPVKSICRFKCVSRHWRGLISHPGHRKKLPQTLSGFFYPRSLPNPKDERTAVPDFVGISGAEDLPFPDPSLPFLPGYRWIRPMDGCGGLLCDCLKVNLRDEFNYVVCNPAADKWVVLPEAPDDGSDDGSSEPTIRLCFDPAISSHFHVVQILHEAYYGYITGLDIYTSETGVWTHKENGWGDEVLLAEPRDGVFMNGMLHLLSRRSTILTVDREGNTWRTIPLLESMGFEKFPPGPVGFLGQSQGHLCYMNTRKPITNKISVWILEDYSAGQWIFKYNISTSQLFGEVDLMMERDYLLVAIHPEANVVFFIWDSENLLMSYDMDQGKVCVICHLTEPVYNTFLPYVPFFHGLADQN